MEGWIRNLTFLLNVLRVIKELFCLLNVIFFQGLTNLAYSGGGKIV